jgi:hypothetical protein
MVCRPWLQNAHQTLYFVECIGRGTSPSYVPETLQNLSENRSQPPPTQQIALEAKGVLTLNAIAYKDIYTIVQISAQLSRFVFSIDEKRHEQITTLFPQSVERVPALGLLLPNQLFERFRVKPTESIPHTWLRGLLLLMQCSVPADLPHSSYQVNESDSRGRYIARYKVSTQRNRVIVEKQRVRYNYSPAQRTVAGALAIRYLPKDKRWQIVLDDQGLVQLQLENETQLVSPSGQLVAQDRMRLNLRRQKVEPVPVREQAAVMQQWEDKERMEVLPWQPFGMGEMPRGDE